MISFDSFITPDEAVFDFGGAPVRKQVMLFAEKFILNAGYLDGGALRRELDFKIGRSPAADLCVVDWESVSRRISPRAVAAVAAETRRAILDHGFRGRILCTGLLSEGMTSRWWAFQEQLSADTYAAMRKRVEPFVPAIRAHDGIAYQLYVPYADTSGEGQARLRAWLHGSADLAAVAIGSERISIPLLSPRYPATALPPATLRPIDTAVIKTIARWIIGRGLERVGLWDFAGVGYEAPGLTDVGTVGMVAATVRQIAQQVEAASATLAPDVDVPSTKSVVVTPSNVKASTTKVGGA